MSLASVSLADRGMMPISDVTVYGPGQKAIIAWNGDKEILILSTDVRASANSRVLEILPLPSEPEIERGDFASFQQVDKLIKKHLPINLRERYKGEEAIPAGVEIIFHQKIGAHDITVVKASSIDELVKWAEEFLKDAGIEYRISLPRLELVVDGYITQDINFFVFDLIEVSPEPKSIEPIVYRFDTEFLYYPLKISTLAKGQTNINLFLLTKERLDSSWLLERSELPQDMKIAMFYDRDGTQLVQFEVTHEELVSVDDDIADLFEGSAWLTAITYHGDLAGLTRDLKIYKAIDAKLLFDYYPGRCTSKDKWEAAVEIFGNMIMIHGVAITPTPCYELAARIDTPRAFVYPPTIIVDITARAKPGVCVECLGEVPFQAKIANLIPGQAYDIIVQYKDKVINQKLVYLPLSSPIRSDYAQLPDKIILETIGTPITGFTFQADGKALPSDAVVRIKVKGNDYRTHIAYLGLDKGRSKAIIEVNDIPATIKLSQNCKLKIIDGQIFLDDSYWLLPVRLMPDEAVGKIKEEVIFIELKAVNGKAVYEVGGVGHEKLLGLVSKEIRLSAQVDAITGEITKEQRPWWTIFCW